MQKGCECFSAGLAVDGKKRVTGEMGRDALVVNEELGDVKVTW